MASRIVCHPPLGQTVWVVEDHIRFTVCIEPEAKAADQNFEVLIWHNGENGEWTELPLASLSDGIDLDIRTVSDEQPDSRYYRSELSVNTSPTQVYFTLKYRAGDQPWQWIKDSFGDKDGEVRFQDPNYKPDSFQSYCPNIDPALEIAPGSTSSDYAHVTLWDIIDSVPGAQDPDSGCSSRNIGVAGDFTHWFGLVRHSTAWLAPRQGKGKISLDAEATLLSLLRKDGQHLILLALAMGNLLTTLNTDKHGNILMVGKNDSLDEDQSVVIAALGPNPEEAIAAATARAEELVRKSQPSSREVWDQVTSRGADGDPEGLEGWYEGLTYCTWNALGQELDEEKIHSALQILSDEGVPITNVLIDDGWQSLDRPGESQFYRGWTDFEASKEDFPNQLSGLAANIRSRHRNIQHIGVWHGLFGYWGGVSPDGNLAQKYKTKHVAIERNYHDRPSMTTFEGDATAKMFEDFYAFLAKSGIDCTKTDNRYLPDCLSSSHDRRTMVRSYNDAWLAASAKHLSMRVVSCMAMIPQYLFSPELLFKPFPAPTTAPRYRKMILRNSDDFFPHADSSHLWHIFWNAHTALLTQHLNIVPDWDIFQSAHPYAAFHAAGRCVSGGPIQLTDTPGDHDITLITQLYATKPDGRSIILRPGVMGRSVDIYTEHAEARFCKVAAFQEVNMQGPGRVAPGIAITGVFNMSTATHAEFVSLGDFPNVEHAGVEYALRSHVTRKVVAPLSAGSGRDLVNLELGYRGFDILTLSPLFPLSGGKKVAVFGLLEKMSGAAAVTSMGVNYEYSIVSVKVKALGILGLYITGREYGEDERAVEATLCGREIEIFYQDMDDVKGGVMVKLQLEWLWRSLKLEEQEIVVEVKV